MQTRSLSWYRCGPVQACSSNDGWLRLRIARRSETPARRSWALDPDAAAKREWRALKIAPPIERPQAPARRVLSSTWPADGVTNPNADARGIVDEVAGGHVYRVPVPGDESSIDLFVARSAEGIRVDLPVGAAERVYGLGEKSGGLDKRGRTWVFWNTDEPFHYPEKDPLYESIPVAYVARPGRVLTVFSDSTAIQYFDVCESDSGALRIEAYDDQVELYLRSDPCPADAVRAYTGLTGRMPLPPEWALGFQQCRYSYFPERRVVDVAERMREERIPCDVLYLDIHYMDGFRVFTWDPERFPDPAQTIARLRRMGLRIVTIVDPGVKTDPDYRTYTDGMTRKAFLTRSDGTLYVGAVWPGAAVFPDFTREEVRRWWAGLHAPLLDAGVDGIWNDMNEPADFSGDAGFRPDFTVPNDLIAGNDGEPVGFGRVHNAYATGMNQATRAALSAARPDERGFVLTRAGYAGIQRYAAVWTGDNHSWWEHVSAMTPMVLNLGLSGVAFAGSDTGGFSANATGDLYARWFAASCLMPFFRAHTAVNTLDHEPWSFGEAVLAAVRGHVELRYQLLPYLYTLFDEASRTGAPVIRPLVFHYPSDPNVAERADSYLVGRSLLVAPVRERGVAERSVYLPEGRWYDFWTGVAHEGPGAIITPAPIGHLPLFLRAGSIIPYEAVRQHTGEPGDGVLRLLVAPDAQGHAGGELYADAGEGHGYRSGEFWRARLVCEANRVRIGEYEDESAPTGSGAGVSRWRRLAAVRVGQGLPVDDTRVVDIAAGEITL